MRVSVSSNIDQVLKDTARLHPQFRFACARALTDTVKLAQEAMPSELEGALDNPVDFTKRGFYIQPARKDNLQASIGVKDKQAEYLAFQIEGGTRSPKKVALRLPSVVDLDEAGNMPRGLVSKLIAAAKSGRKLGKRLATRAGLAQDAQLFYGKPGNSSLPAGIYRREQRGTRSVLVPVVVFPRQVAKYERRFDFYGATQRIVSREFEGALDRAWAQALATAR